VRFNVCRGDHDRPNLLVKPIRLALSPIPVFTAGIGQARRMPLLRFPISSSAFTAQSRYPVLPAAGRSRFGPWGCFFNAA
jgi:hypothetical protein